MKVFVFPSLKDTQGWVLHEAAHTGLPIVLIDQKVTQVVRDGENGFFVENTPDDMSDRIIELLENDELRKSMGKKSQEIAATLTEASQVKKLEGLYRRVVAAAEDKE